MLEIFCLLIVLSWFGLRLPVASSRPRLLAEAGVVMALAWAAEQSCISLYAFYSYAGRWAVTLGDVPLTVLLIWPVVVLSARDVVVALAGRGRLRVALVAFAVITADAAFIEPAAVHARLWEWTVPGVFAVPLIGILGWGIFGGWMVWALDSPVAGGARRLAALAAVLPGLHLCLLALWWGGMRPLALPVPDHLAVLAILAATAPAALWLWRGAPRVPRRFVALRLPGALFFAAVLATAAPSPGLIAWLAALSLPWVAMWWSGEAAPARMPSKT